MKCAQRTTAALFTTLLKTADNGLCPFSTLFYSEHIFFFFLQANAANIVVTLETKGMLFCFFYTPNPPPAKKKKMVLKQRNLIEGVTELFGINDEPRPEPDELVLLLVFIVIIG